MHVLRVSAVVPGVALAAYVLLSAVKTVVVPRAIRSQLTRWHFQAVARLTRLGTIRRRTSWDLYEPVWAMYGPIALLTLPLLWVTLLIGAFTVILWALGTSPFSEALAISGSSLVTLGFERPIGTGLELVAVAEAALGLGLVSLMISYLPTIYGAFSRREALVAMLEVRAGLPPAPVSMIARYHRIGWLDHLSQDLFARWEQWFVDIEESHTSHNALAFFRSPQPARHWLTAAGCVLDSAALTISALDLPDEPEASILIRTGFLCLRRIADVFVIPYDPDPAPTAPISVRRDEFDLCLDELAALGVPVRADREQAWADFAGWRVNYDAALVGLCDLLRPPPAVWSSDRLAAKPPRVRRVRIRRSAAGG